MIVHADDRPRLRFAFHMFDFGAEHPRMSGFKPLLATSV
jgi:hypothetical protein